MIGRLLVAAAIVACSAPAKPTFAPPSSPAVGAPAPSTQAPPPPAARLPRHFVPVEHAAELSLFDTHLDGTMTITGDITEPAPVIWLHALDLVIHRATATQGSTTRELAVTVQPATETIALAPEQPLAPGRWTIALDYRAPIRDHGVIDRGVFPDPQPQGIGAFSQVLDGKRYTFTNFEPIDARRVFPCIDEPDRKVPWQLTIEAAKGQLVVANTPIVRTTPAGDRVRVEFAKTQPLPSYLIAFAAGPFEIVDAGRSKSGVPIRILAPESDDARWAAPYPAKILDALEAWVELPYAYGKLDFVAVPRTGPNWGAMENPGLVTFDASQLDDHALWVGVMEHELAHQWFGNLVTLAWWDDIWLNEAFATWLAPQLHVSDRLPSHSLFRAPRWASPANQHVMRLPPRTIRIPLALTEKRGDLSAYFSGMYGVPIIDRLARHLGKAELQRALRMYLRKHAHRNAHTADLAAVLSTVAGHALGPTLERELDDKPHPRVTVTPSCNGKPELQIKTPDAVAGAAPVCVAYDRDGTRGDVCRALDGPLTIMPLPAKRCPLWVLPDPRGIGFLSIDREKPTVDAVLRHGLHQLGDHEQLQLLHSPQVRLADQLTIAARLATSADPDIRELAVKKLRTFAPHVPADLRGRYEAWIRTHFVARTRAAGFSGATPGIHSLVASLPDPVLGKRAAALLPKLRELSLDYQAIGAILAHAANHDRDSAARVLMLGDFNVLRYFVSLALADSRFVVELARTEWERFAHPLMKRALTQRCDATRRAEIATLPFDVTKRDQLLKELDRCIAHGATLDAAFRKWLAPKAP